ncbi:hypothetical protein V9L05_06720 [Bernardetia sp. Wsw4-3y2]|uniref:hypothetical protein n=1 Tax=Bernardetia sp. Wsw4-3y2 TaxID=3127471 RepID=UPI0030CB9363
MKLFYINIDPHIPKPISKYIAASIKSTLLAFGLFLYKKTPITLNNRGGPNITPIIRAINPFRFPISSIIV